MNSQSESLNPPLKQADQKALKKLTVQAKLALQYCQTVTGGNVLTPAEYASASAEFQELIATPYTKGEPIYIMPPAHETVEALFGALVYANEWPHQIITVGTELLLLLPSSSLVKTYLETMNPERPFQYKRRLGKITPEMMETYSEQNMRVGNLFAPGVTGPSYVHKNFSLPILIVEHDMYHAYFEGLLSVQNYAQMMRAKHVLRQVLSATEQTFTSEMMRCIERERRPSLSEHERFLELLKYVFAVNPDAEDTELRNSSVVILCDIFLNPQSWPYAVSLKKQLLQLLYPGKNKPSLSHWETAIQRYASLVQRDVGRVAMLALCHFSLQDEVLALALANHIQQSDPLTQIKWIKNEKKHLQPVFKQAALVYNLETVRAWPPAKRVEMLAPSLYYLEYATDLPAMITALGGKICSQQPKRGYLRFSISCHQLSTNVRRQLGCDRVRAINMQPAQLAYLQKSIPSITLEADQTGGILCTFPKRYRPEVSQVITQWNVVQKSIQIQQVARAYLARKGFYTKAKQQITEQPAAEIPSLEKR